MPKDQMCEAFLESTPDIIFLMDGEGTFLDFHAANPAELYLAPEQFLGKRMSDVMPADIAAPSMAEIHTALHTNTIMSSEYDLDIRGDIRHYDRRTIPYRKDKVLIIVRDITERNRADNMLRKSQHYFRSLDRINRVMAQARDVNNLIHQAVQEILDIFSVDRAWLLYPCDPQVTTWSVPVEASRPEYPGAFIEGLVMPIDATSKRVFTTALSCNDAFVNDFADDETAKDYLQRFQIQTQLCIALRPRIGNAWLLGMHQCTHKRNWSTEDKQLFRDISERIADGLTNLVLLQQLEQDIQERELAEIRATELLHQNRALTQQLFTIQEEDRRLLARELHDELGQWLTAIALHSQILNNRCTQDDKPIRECADVILYSSKQIQNHFQTLLSQLRPSLLDELGLLESLQELVNQWQHRHPDTLCDFTTELPEHGFGDPIDISLYRLIQESLNNIAKHAVASHVAIKLWVTTEGQAETSRIHLTIEDDGKGMDALPPQQGIGLHGMRERVIALGGEFVLDSQPGKGTHIAISLPANNVNIL